MSLIDPKALQEIHQETLPLIQEAGRLAMKHFQNVAAERKPDRSYVTAADREVEALLRDEFEKRFPAFGIIGEEHGTSQVDQAECVWAIDPIDGTEPFVLEMPVWAVSVGLVAKTGPLLGYVMLPAIDQLYTAVTGQPAYENDRVIETHPHTTLGPGTTIIGPSSTFHHFNTSYPGRVLSFGSAAAHLAFVSRGKLHGGIFEKINLYDIAGGACILQSAGGVMRYLSGDDVNLWDLVESPSHQTREALTVGHPENAEQLRHQFSQKSEPTAQ